MKALKTLRTCLGLEDIVFDKLLIRNKIFGAVVELLMDTQDRNNLINSACLEFFVHVGSHGSRVLVHHVAQFRTAFQNYEAFLQDLLDRIDVEVPVPKLEKRKAVEGSEENSEESSEENSRRKAKAKLI
ncbi:Platinum sensitivity protein [Mortierella sp. NVP41]|nr:Platinum sensitivity protein [Mortierella sp. NVP41]